MVLVSHLIKNLYAFHWNSSHLTANVKSLCLCICIRIVIKWIKGFSFFRINNQFSRVQEGHLGFILEVQGEVLIGGSRGLQPWTILFGGSEQSFLKYIMVMVYGLSPTPNMNFRHLRAEIIVWTHFLLYLITQMFSLLSILQ